MRIYVHDGPIDGETDPESLGDGDANSHRDGTVVRINKIR